MYLHIGNNHVVETSSVVGIFDIEKVTSDKRGRDYLNRAAKEGRVVYTTDELPRSFVVTAERVYISQISPITLAKREMQM